MYHFKTNELSKNDSYKLLNGIIVPRPISWITTISKNGGINLAPFSFFNVVAKEKPLLSVSILRKDNGTLKDTASNIIENKEAVVHLVTEDVLHDASNSSAPISSERSESEELDLDLITSNTIKTPGILKAKVRMETKLFNHIPIKNGDVVISDMFILEVVDFHLDESVINKNNLHLDITELKPVARLSGPNYSVIKEIEQTIIRPKDI